jgi:hypothetical protein
MPSKTLSFWKALRKQTDCFRSVADLRNRAHGFWKAARRAPPAAADSAYAPAAPWRARSPRAPGLRTQVERRIVRRPAATFEHICPGPVKNGTSGQYSIFHDHLTTAAYLNHNRFRSLTIDFILIPCIISNSTPLWKPLSYSAWQRKQSGTQE